jgi:hypothetical protein
MIVTVRFDVPDEVRRSMRHRLGKGGLASRSEIENDIRGNMRILWDDYVQDYEADVLYRESEINRGEEP